ncbi:MAG: hypothetical protein WC649_07705 [Desulfobacteria bacterium]
MKRTIVFITTLFLLILVSGCATSLTNNRRLNVEPLFNYDKDIDKESTELDAAGPFFTFQSKPKEKEYGFRPFFYVREKEDDHFKEVEFLYPLGKYRKTDKERVSQFIPFFSSHKDLTEDSKKPSDFGFFPVFWGKDEEEKSYWGVFPIYGRLNHRFGKDQIRFVLWPVYSDSKEDDSWTYNVLWPIFSYTTGGDKRVFKAWPLYGHEEKTGEYSKYFALWPIFFFQKTDLDTDNPQRFTAVFPLFVDSSSPQKDSKSFLWPFFSYTNDKANNYKQWDMPWPIFHYGKGKEIESFRLFPLYGYKTKPDSKTRFFLWPLYTYDKEILEDHEDTTYRFLLINKYQRMVWKGDFRDAKSVRIWPIFYYNRKHDGSIKFSFPELIPLEDEGFERNWAPLFRLYQYKGDATGNMESKFLWGLYRHKKMDSKEFFELTFLLSYEKEKNRRCFSVLKGLFEYRQENSLNSIKLFYLPRLIKWESGEEYPKQSVLPASRRLGDSLVYEGIK